MSLVSGVFRNQTLNLGALGKPQLLTLRESQRLRKENDLRCHLSGIEPNLNSWKLDGITSRWNKEDTPWSKLQEYTVTKIVIYSCF